MEAGPFWKHPHPVGCFQDASSPNLKDPLLPYRELMGGGVQNQGMTSSCITYPCEQVTERTMLRFTLQIDPRIITSKLVGYLEVI